ncbi:MAG TPA: IS110 family transposase [Streptosporangiaceae bacterium]|nr:IS110 family transposase [Streptosporangiaceae bacterium]
MRHERVAGIDVAKAKADVCTRLPPARDGGRRRSRVAEFPATVAGVTELAVQLAADGVELVSMESTSDYWRLWFFVLEAAGLKVQLVSSSQARQLAGRPKTDRLDAQWIARLTEMGLLRPCFVPPAEIRELRDWARARQHLVQDRTREWQRLEKLLEGALVKVSSVVSSLAGNKTARAIVEALIEGERDPARLAGLALGSLRGKRAELAAALDGAAFGPHHARLARVHLGRIDAMDRDVAMLDDEIAACLDAIPAAQGVTAAGARCADPGEDAAVLPAAQRLAEIPGVTVKLAAAIIAETGLDMSRFPTAGHLASWAGLAPSARQSGSLSRKPGKKQGNAYLRGHCTQAASGAARTDTFLGERLRRLARRSGGARARCAVARSVLVIVWHLLSDPSARYADLGPDWHQRKADRDKKIRGHLRQLRALGLNVTVTEPAA